MLALISCGNAKEKIVKSPDRKLIITCKEYDYPGTEKEWINAVKFYSDGKWQEFPENPIYTDYFCEELGLEEYYSELQKEEFSEYDPGLNPIRIDQCALLDGTPIYLVYAETYSNRTWHFFSYTALCIKDNKLYRYPLFKNMMDEVDILSDVIIIGPASIGLDFTGRPAQYEYEIDEKINDAPIEKKIVFDEKKGQLIIADELLLRVL